MAPTRRRRVPAVSPRRPPDRPLWRLCVYIAGQTPRSAAVLATVQQICERYLANRCDVQVIDILKKPALAVEDQIVAVPTLDRLFPLPHRRLVGNLADRERVLAGLDLG